LHQVGDLFELNVKLRCQKVNQTDIHSAGQTIALIWNPEFQQVNIRARHCSLLEVVSYNGKTDRFDSS